MKKAIGFVLLALLAVPAFAADVARDPNVVIEGVPSPTAPQYRQGSVLVVTVTAGGVFTDNSAEYVTAFGNAGLLADLAVDPHVSGWPSLAPYDIVLVCYNDCWWGTEFGPADEQIMSGYNGCLIIVGQDYCYSVGTGFVIPRFGIASILQDVNFGLAGAMSLTGLGTFAGLSDNTPAACWTGNGWFTDDVNVGAGSETSDWSGEGFSGQGGSSVSDGIFSSNAFECFSNLQQWVDAMVAHCGTTPPTPTEDATWSQLKGLY